MADPTNEPLDLDKGQDLDAIDRPLGDGASTNPQDPNTLSVIHQGGDPGYQGQPTAGEPTPIDGIDDLQIENIDSQNAPEQIDGIDPLTEDGGDQGAAQSQTQANTGNRAESQGRTQEPDEPTQVPDGAGETRMGRTTVGDFETFGGDVGGGTEEVETTLEEQLEANEEEGGAETDETEAVTEQQANAAPVAQEDPVEPDAVVQQSAVVEEPVVEPPVVPTPGPTPDPVPDPTPTPDPVEDPVAVEAPVVEEDPVPVVDDVVIEEAVAEPAAIPGAPTFDNTNAFGNEDAAIALAINLDDSNDSTISMSEVTFSGVPSGAVLSAGVANEDGSWTVPASDLDGLTITPPENSNEDFSLTASVTTANSATGSDTVVTLAVPVSVTGVADAPVIDLGDVQGDEDTVIDLPIDITLADNDDSETLFVTISNVPEGATLSAGVDNDDGTWTMSPGDLDGLTIEPPEHFSGTLNLEIKAVSQEDDGDVAETSAVLPVVVGAVADEPEGTAESDGGDEDVFIPIEIETSLVDIDGSESLSIVVSDIPEGATLTNDLGETFEGFDSVELAPEQIVGLQIRGPEHFSGEIELTVTATATEATGETAKTVQSVVVDIAPVVDAPVLSVVAAEGQEDEFIALNVSAAFPDQDGSEVHSVVISDIPDGAVIKNSAGDTFSGADSIELTPAQLVGLSIKAPDHVSDDFQLQVEATAEEDVSGSTSTVSATLSVEVNAVADAPDLVVSATATAEVQDSTESQQAASEENDNLSGDAGDNVIDGNAGNDVIYGDQQNFVSVVSLDVSAALVDSDGTEILTVALDGIPSGATLSHGTLQGDGSWALNQDDLDAVAEDGLSLRLVGDVADFEIDVTATATDRDPETGTETQSSTTATVGVTVDREAAVGNDGLSGGKGEDELHGMGGDDRVEGGQGDDVLYGEDGDDVLIGDEGTGSGPSDIINHDWSHADPFPDMTERRSLGSDEVNGLDPSANFALEADHQVTLTFLDEGAGYKNSLGYYKIGPDGEISDVQMVFDNASKQGSGGSLISNQSSVTLDLEAGETFALFIVANGYSKNNFSNFDEGQFEFRDGDAGATVNSTNPQLVWVDDEGATTNVSGSVFHTAGTDQSIPLNYDGQQHVVSGYDSETGGMVIGFEDLNNGGDKDYNDLIVRVDIDPVVQDIEGASDTLFGGAGNDSLYGNEGDDKLDGGTGNDLLDGGAGADVVDGGEGDDSGTFTVGEASGTDVYMGGEGQDDLTVRVSAQDLRNPDIVQELQSLRDAIENGDTESQTFSNLHLTAEGWESVSIVDMDGNAVDIDVDGASITVSAASGSEDSGIPLDIDIGLRDADGSEKITDIVISGVPSGASLSAGSRNSDGSWNLDVAELNGLSITPSENSDADFSLSVSVTVEESTTGESLTSVESLAVSVSGVADGAEVGVAGDSTITVQVSGDHYLGAPKAQIIVDGKNMGTFTVTADRAEDETQEITVTGDFGINGPESVEVHFINDAYKKGVGDRNLIVDSIEVNGTRYEAEGPDVVYDKSSGADIAGQEVMPWRGALVFNTADNGGPGEAASGLEDTLISLNQSIFLNDGDGSEEIVGVEISGLPNGAELSHGEDIGGGVWRVDPDDLSSVQVRAPANSDADLSLTVSVTTEEKGSGNQATSSFGVSVAIAAVADAPNLVVSAAEGAAGESISLGINASLSDSDGSESLVILISGVPDGAQLSAGTDNGGGSWTLSAQDLGGLSLTVPEAFEGQLSLSVTAQSSEIEGSTAETSADLGITVLPVEPEDASEKIALSEFAEDGDDLEGDEDDVEAGDSEEEGDLEGDEDDVEAGDSEEEGDDPEGGAEEASDGAEPEDDLEDEEGGESEGGETDTPEEDGLNVAGVGLEVESSGEEDQDDALSEEEAPAGDEAAEAENVSEESETASEEQGGEGEDSSDAETAQDEGDDEELGGESPSDDDEQVQGDDSEVSDSDTDDTEEEDSTASGAPAGKSGESVDDEQDRTVFDLIASEDDSSGSENAEEPESLDEEDVTSVDAEESGDWMEAIEDQDEAEDEGLDLFDEGAADAPLIDDTPDSAYDDNSGSVI